MTNNNRSYGLVFCPVCRTAVPVEGHDCKPAPADTDTITVTFDDSTRLMTTKRGNLTANSPYSAIPDIVLYAFHDLTNGTLTPQLTMEMANRLFAQMVFGGPTQ